MNNHDDFVSSKHNNEHFALPGRDDWSPLDARVRAHQIAMGRASPSLSGQFVSILLGSACSASQLELFKTKCFVCSPRVETAVTRTGTRTSSSKAGPGRDPAAFRALTATGPAQGWASGLADSPSATAAAWLGGWPPCAAEPRPSAASASCPRRPCPTCSSSSTLCSSSSPSA